jgi:hypothetical protein
MLSFQKKVSNFIIIAFEDQIYLELSKRYVPKKYTVFNHMNINRMNINKKNRNMIKTNKLIIKKSTLFVIN